VPSSAVVRSRFAVDALWDAAEEKRPRESIAEPARAPETLFVWRDGIDVYHRRADDHEAPLIELLEAGAPFGLLCERLAEGRAIEEASQLAFALLTRWAIAGLLVAF
jgi:hypothetical protein